jgi:hypothetical protein
MARNFKEVGMRINTSPEQKDSIFKLHAKGLTNRQIAAHVGIHHRTVGDHLRRKKLRPNGTVKQPIEMVDQDTASCSKCQEVKPISEFLLNRRNAKYPYRLSYCNRCRLNQVNRSLRTSIERFLRDRCARLRRRCAQEGVHIDIDAAYLISLYRRQEGKCFYTDIPMEWDQAKGLRRHALSIDKITPAHGYVKGNVVLCVARVNTIKSDVSLDEMKLWMPGWYQRVVYMWRELGLTCFQVAPGDF